MTTTIDPRELIPVDYSLLDIATLEALKANLFHTIVQEENGLIFRHREFNAVKLALRNKKAAQHEQQPEADHANG